MAQRVYTAEQWTKDNPILLKGEIGVESDTSLFKFGDEVTPWNDLPYARTIIDASVNEDSDNPVSGAAVAEQLNTKQDKIRSVAITLKTDKWISMNPELAIMVAVENNESIKNLGEVQNIDETLVEDLEDDSYLGKTNVVTEDVDISNLNENEYLGEFSQSDDGSSGDDSGGSGDSEGSGGSGCDCDHDLTDTIDELAPYSQAITINDLASNERIDLYPSHETLQYLIENGIGLMAINEDGEATIIAYNHNPAKDLTIDAILTKI